MNQPTQQATPTTSPTEQAAPVAPSESYEERVARVFADKDGASSAQPADGSDPTAPPTAPGAPAASAPDQAAEERRKRLAQLEAEERNRVDAQAKHREVEQIRQRLAAAERERDEAKQRAQHLVDPSALDEEGFFGVLDKVFERVPADKLGQKIRERMTNPEIAAAQAAKKAVDPELAALKSELATTKEQLSSFMQQHLSASEQAAEAQAAHEFGGYVAANAAVAPHSAAFLREMGGQEFYKLALSAAAKLPANAGPQAVLDRIEEDILDNRDKAERLARIYAPQSATQQRQAPTPNPAAAKAMTTVSNTLAQQRASVVDEDAEWASLPFEERSARLFR